MAKNIDVSFDCSTFDKFIEPVRSTVKEIDSNRNVHHNEKLSFQEFFRLLSFYFVSGIESISLLLNRFENRLVSNSLKLADIPRSTFNDAFERFDVSYFKDIYLKLLGSVNLKAIPELVVFGTICLVDGSVFPILNSMMWANYKEKIQAARLHLCFELNRMIAVDFIVGTGKSCERTALRNMLKSGVTYVADRGYQCFNLFHDIVQANSNFVFRVKDNIRYILNKSLNVQLPKPFSNMFEEVCDLLVVGVSDKHGRIYRLVKFTFGTEQFSIMTSRLDISTFEVILLYAYRWQIELLFRFLKRSMNGIHIIDNSREGVTIQFYMMLITAVLQLKLKQDCIEQQEGTEQDLEDDTDEQPKHAELLSESAASNDPLIQSNHMKDQDDINESHDLNVRMHNDERLFDEITCEDFRFLKHIGDKLKKYWKISIYWLDTLQNILSIPFDSHAVLLLSRG